ncbi:MAG: hypothetical protein ACTS6O_05605 [Giesbergeria sp.]
MKTIDMTSIHAAALAAALTFAGPAMAQPTAPLSAQASDPTAMGWMQGFPSAADKTIRFTDPDYFTFPKLRWTVCHFRELMPTTSVANGSAGTRPLPTALDTSLDTVRFTPLGAKAPGMGD